MRRSPKQPRRKTCGSSNHISNTVLATTITTNVILWFRENHIQAKEERRKSVLDFDLSDNKFVFVDREFQIVTQLPVEFLEESFRDCYYGTVTSFP
jgi:hypothetical protein